MFLPQAKRWEVESLRLALPNGHNTVCASLRFHLRTETSIFQNAMLFQNTGRWRRSRNPVTPIGIHYRQNFLKSIGIVGVRKNVSSEFNFGLYRFRRNVNLHRVKI
jgi:hypothetical protein